MKLFNLKGKDLTSESITEKVSDQQIYEFYLGEYISFSRKYKSPFRPDDKDPSLTFLVANDGRVLWRDWGDPEMSASHGVFQFIMKLECCDFQDALKHINTDLKLGLGDDSDKLDPNPKYSFMDIPAKREKDIHEPRTKIIEIERQSFTKEDVQYWSEYGIDTGLLLRYGVSSVKYVWLDQTLVREYSRSNPVFSYHLGHDDGVERYKIYSPNAITRSKWLTNARQNTIQGLSQLDWVTGEDLIITKSLKDVMVLNKLGYHAIALQSEGSKLEEHSAASFKSIFNDIYVFYDNDSTGQRKSSELCMEHGFKRIQLKEMYQAKDISDFVKLNDLEAARIMMLVILEQSDEGLPF